MSRHSRRTQPLNAAYGYAPDVDGAYRPVAVDERTPLTELERAEEPHQEDERLHEQVRMFRWLFEQYALRADGELHTPAGIAMRVCCLASLLGLPPVEGMTFTQIAEYCGVTRAAVSKAMLDLSFVTGIHSRQQRSEHARTAYRQRAIRIHRQRQHDAAALTTDIETATLTTESRR